MRETFGKHLGYLFDSIANNPPPEIMGRALGYYASLAGVRRGFLERDSILRKRILAALRMERLTRWIMFRRWVGGQLIRMGKEITKIGDSIRW